MPMNKWDGGLGLVQRAAGMLIRPAQTWAEIAQEPSTTGSIFTGYVMVLGLVNPICLTLGRLVFGERSLGAIYHPPILAALTEAVVGYVIILMSVWALSFLIEVLSRPFGAARDRLSAFKVAAYASTPGWLASAAYLSPAFGLLLVLGQLYTLYLLYRGVQILLQPSSGRAIGYVALVVVCYMVLMMLAISLTKLISAYV